LKGISNRGPNAPINGRRRQLGLVVPTQEVRNGTVMIRKSAANKAKDHAPKLFRDLRAIADLGFGVAAVCCIQRESLVL
jgi:hypothetical protein